MSRKKKTITMLRNAAQLHNSGRLKEAEAIYNDVLKLEPRNGDALSLLGAIAFGRGDHARAVGLLRAAIAVNRHHAGYHWILGNTLMEQGKAAEAAISYRRAIEIKPLYVEAHNNLGNALLTLGRLDEAEACFRRAIALKPTYAFAYNNLGSTLRRKGKLDQATRCHQQAIAIDPTYAEAHFNLGNALSEQGKPEEAIACFRHAIAGKPAYAQAYNNLGNALRDLTRLDEAILCFHQAIAIEPRCALTHNNLGSALRDRGKVEDAIACHRRAIEIDPGYAEAYFNLGNGRQIQNNLEAAISCYQKALELSPTNYKALSQYVHSANRACLWHPAQRYREELISKCSLSDFDGAPFPILSISDDPAVALAAAQHYRKNCVPFRAPLLYLGERDAHRKIRLAYLSADFHEHATSYLIAELFERHDRAQFELYGISFGPDDSGATRARLINALDQFIDVRNFSDKEAAQKLRDLEIDIAIDLKGYTRDSREGILAYRPAPIQVNYLGYPGTMGAEFIDYIVVDPFVTPADSQHYFTERLVLLPGSYQVNDTKRVIAERTPTRSECGLPVSGFVFCCFNNAHKITPVMFEIWMRLLRTVPSSVLWLFSDNDLAEENLRREAQARGVDPIRLVFAPRVPLANHLARHRLADLFVDTLPYNAHTTASDALWAGLPLLTCSGRSFPSRVAGSLLRAVGLQELITCNLIEYEALALKLANCPQELARVNAKLRQSRVKASLFDTDRFRRHLEAAYCQMWTIWQEGDEPRTFTISDKQN